MIKRITGDSDRQNGFTLLEVMAAMLLFSLIMAGMVPVFTAHMRANTQNEIRTGALNAAQFVLDQIRLEDPSDLPASGPGPVEIVPIGGRDYEVTASYCTVSSFCTTANNRHIEIEVVYRGDVIFTTETVYTQLR